MNSYYHQYRQGLWATDRLRRAVLISLMAHLVLGLVAFQAFKHPRPVFRQNIYHVQFVPIQPPETPKEKEPETPVPQEPEPELEPEPEPKPKPEPEPKPKPKVEPRPKPPKPKPKSAPKPESKPAPKPKTPAPTGITMKQKLPSVLDVWGRLVQRKVEKYWEVPPGIRLDLDNNEAEVAFWVGRDGDLLGEPQVVKHASDTALGESGVRAIKLSAPLPPLPEDYEEPEQQVVYVFALVR